MSDNDSGRFFVQTHNRPTENSEFVNRQKNVFEKLDAVLKDNENSIQAQNSSKRQVDCEEKTSFKKLRYDTRQFRGQESIFKRPEPPPPSRFIKSIPDYLKNPRKWTKYTLGDVSQEDMSDKSNTAAAMSFLRELKAKKEYEDMDVDTEVKQITFVKRPTYSNREQDAEQSDGTLKNASSSFRSSKVVMPEYVVGEKRVVTKRNSLKPTVRTSKTKEIKLDHLIEETDEF